MHLRSLIERRDLWTIGIYKLASRQDILSIEEHKPVYLIGERGFRSGYDYQSLVADPFLFAFGGTLFLFYEVKTDHGHGEIWAQSLSQKGEWISLGCVVREEFHLSYPQVFEHGGHVYMIPEAAQSGKVLLYTAVDFPAKWEICGTLIDEPLVDPTLLIRDDDGFLLLATTRDYALKLYYSRAIEGPFSDSGIVVSKDNSVSRCAGPILHIDGSYYRPAQDCSMAYGKRIRLLHIINASRHAYDEELAVADLFSAKPTWMVVGSHHLSSAEFGGSVYVAVDGRRKDRYVNTILFGILKLCGRFLNRN